MQFVVGIDEVGRGPLAGPVSVCVVVCKREVYTELKRDKSLPKAGKDSKKLKAEEREKYSENIKILSKTGFISYSVSHISNKIIDSRGISFAIKKAIAQNISRLKLNPKNCVVYLDGGLKAGVEFKNQKTIIKGDEKEKIIAWASILAKVSRDNLMHRLSRRYPYYGLEVHKGYGTEKHRKTIVKYGISDIHRISFCRNIDVLT